MASDRDALEELRSVSRMDAIHPVKHFLYLPTKRAAEKAVTMLESMEMKVERPYKTYDSTWSVTAITHIVPTEPAIAKLRSLLEQVAEENGGEYDGWEAEVQP